MTDLEYRDVERALAQYFSIQESGIKAFRARIRHFRNLGIPDIPKVGKGSRAAYSQEHVFELWFALVLTEAGLAPSPITDFIGINRKELARWVGSCSEQPRKSLYLGVSIRTIGPQPDDLTITGAFLKERNKLWKECRSFMEGGLPHMLIIDFASGVQRLNKILR